MPRTRLAVVLTALGTVVFLLAAFPGCKSDSGSTGVPTSITVTGKVISGNKLPISNSAVVITGRPATTTDANGSFTVTDVTAPYDLTVVSLKVSFTYRGLSRSDPTIVILLADIPPNNATVSGTISGGGSFPLPANRVLNVSLSSPEVSVPASLNITTGAYMANPYWAGGATITMILRALQWDNNAAGMPTTFVGYGEKTGVAITAGGTFAGQNIAMTNVSTQNISGTVIVPAALVLNNKSLSLAFPNNGNMTLGTEVGTATAFTYGVPAITGITLSVGALAGSGGATSTALKAGIAPGTTGIALTLPDLMALSLPVNAATGVTTTTPFSWTPLSSAIYQMTLYGPGNQPSYLVFTGGNSGTIPDLTALGLGLPKNTLYTWYITSYGPFANIDAAASAYGIYPQGDVIQSASSQRTFTTAP